MRTYDYPVISSVDGTTDPSSAIIDCSSMYECSLESVATGTIAGTMNIQVSNDKINFVDLTSSSLSVSSAGSLMTGVLSLAHQWLKVVFAHSGGSGNVSGILKMNGH